MKSSSSSSKPRSAKKRPRKKASTKKLPTRTDPEVERLRVDGRTIGPNGESRPAWTHFCGFNAAEAVALAQEKVGSDADIAEVERVANELRGKFVRVHQDKYKRFLDKDNAGVYRAGGQGPTARRELVAAPALDDIATERSQLVQARRQLLGLDGRVLTGGPPKLLVTPEDKARAELASRELAGRKLLPYIMRFKDDYEAGWFHKVLCQELEDFTAAVERKESPRLILTVPPRHGKSTIISQFFPSWYLGRNPSHEIILTTYGADFSADWSRLNQDLLRDPDYMNVFPGVGLLKDNEQIGRWSTALNGRRAGGGLLAAGANGPIVGRGGHIGIIDDPFKSNIEAESQSHRDRVWDWYRGVFYNRLAPGGGVVLVMCMVGDTQVLMADGTEKALRDVRAGDAVASYDEGKIVTTQVLNWVNQGPDDVFTIETESGTKLRANARHPFLVERNGERLWIPLKNLHVHDTLVRLSGGHGKACSAPRKDATGLLSARGYAPNTTTGSVGTPESDPHLITPKLAGTSELRADMVSDSPNTTKCSPSRTASAPYVGSPRGIMSEPTGVASCASTTAMRPAKFARSCAMTAISPLGTEKPKQCCSPPLSTYEITLDRIASITPSGREDVFDIQVERTENFIANGVCSHNTRWHFDDLVGRLLKEMQEGRRIERETGEWPDDVDRWRVLSFPAIAVRDEQFRAAGEPLHPERYDLKQLMRIKRTSGPRSWSALFQQSPRSEEGAYFHVTKVGWYRRENVQTSGMVMVGAADLAISKLDTANKTVLGVAGKDGAGKVHMLDFEAGRWGSDEIAARVIKICHKWGLRDFGLEDGHIFKAMEPLFPYICEDLNKKERTDKYKVPNLIPLKVGKSDKPLRARQIQSIVENGDFLLPEEADWTPSLLTNMSEFPNGAEDDDVDTIAWIGQLIIHLEYKGPVNNSRRKGSESWKDKLKRFVARNNSGSTYMGA